MDPICDGTPISGQFPSFVKERKRVAGVKDTGHSERREDQKKTEPRQLRAYHDRVWAHKVDDGPHKIIEERVIVRHAHNEHVRVGFGVVTIL